MKKINLFKPVNKNKRIEYSDSIMQAVCDRRITGLKINCNGGFDYIDKRHHYLRLLILRGQVSVIYTGQDLLASKEYLHALKEGQGHISSWASIRVIFENRCTGTSPSGLPMSPKNCAYASPKRIESAKTRFNDFFNKKMA